MVARMSFGKLLHWLSHHPVGKKYEEIETGLRRKWASLSFWFASHQLGPDPSKEETHTIPVFA